MSDDVAVAQARLLLTSMYEEVAEISRKLEATENRGRGAPTRGSTQDRTQETGLRRELYEAHRLIDGLHRRFPETAPRPRQVNSPANRA